jgi:hypothetical protein
MMPHWLSLAATISLIAGGISFLIIAADIAIGYRQRMWIMDLVWPITALYAGPLALWAYFTLGKRSLRKPSSPAMTGGEGKPGAMYPWWQMTAVATTHCGSGCTIGDLISESFLAYFPITLFGMALYGSWALDFVLACGFGVAFQYFTIKPMRNLTPREGLIAALKADTLSLTAWQIGMYGWMAIVEFVIVGHPLEKTDPVFWFMMQIAMLCGFITSYPVNWWLLKAGIKEEM